MPLVVVCGHPASGKSVCARALLDFFLKTKEERKENFDVVLITDESLGIDRSKAYTDSKSERQTRALIRSQVERSVSKRSVVILDTLNSIKGFRYELFTRAKAANTTHCVVFCDTPIDRCREWNQTREEAARYDDATFDELLTRLEPPDSSVRWDNPLFTVPEGGDIPFQEIYNYAVSGKEEKSSMATTLEKPSASNALFSRDQTLRAVEQALLEAQSQGLISCPVPVPHTDGKLNLPRKVSPAELRRYRRQFIKMLEVNPLDTQEKLARGFVQYLSTNVR